MPGVFAGHCTTRHCNELREDALPKAEESVTQSDIYSDKCDKSGSCVNVFHEPLQPNRAKSIQGV